MEIIVMKGYAFKIFDTIDGKDSTETVLIREVTPGCQNAFNWW